MASGPRGSRANRTLRTVPPSLAAPYPEAHDAAARAVAVLPAAMGGLGLSSAALVSPELNSPAHGPGPPSLQEAEAAELGCKRKAGRLSPLGTRPRAVAILAAIPSSKALLRSQAGAQAGAWLTAMPADASTGFHASCAAAPAAAVPAHCSQPAAVGASLTLSGITPLPVRGLVCSLGAKIAERACVRVAREAAGPKGQVVPQQWLAHTTAAGVDARDRRRLDWSCGRRRRNAPACASRRSSACLAESLACGALLPPFHAFVDVSPEGRLQGENNKKDSQALRWLCRVCCSKRRPFCQPVLHCSSPDQSRQVCWHHPRP